MSQSLSAARDFGVQSFCFRNFKDNADVAAKVREIGVDKVELCAIHADFDKPAAFDEVLRPYQEAGVSLVSLGVETYGPDEAFIRNRFEFAKAAGAKHVSAHFKVHNFTEAMPVVAKLLEEYDLRMGIHCHGGYMFGGSPDELKHLIDLGGERVGLCLDTAWCMQIGPNVGKPVEWVTETFKGRVYGVHYKDFLFDERAQWRDVVVGKGNLDLPAFVGALESTNFDGFAVIEYEADADNPVPALAECVRQMREA